MYNKSRMSAPPRFPEFKTIELDDRDSIHQRLLDYQPANSELTFTNLFMWRNHYNFCWSVYEDWMVVLGSDPNGQPYALTPIGPANRERVVVALLEWLHRDRGVTRAAVERADQRLITELQGSPHFVIEPLRDHFDYVYRIEDLIQLQGGNYRAKRNHINYFLRSYQFAYEPLGPEHKSACLDLMEMWCDVRRCEDDLSLSSEWDAIREALENLERLSVTGGVILINGKIEAFTIGELLNRETVVVHIEKANMDIRGLYAMINQQFCQNAWKEIPWVNREQDLGEPGLREAKLSYNPDHFVEKFRIRLV